MKRSILAIFVLSLAACNNKGADAGAGNKDSALLSTKLINNPRSAEGTDPAAMKSLATMDFKDTMHDFGNMKEGEKAEYDFEFTNNGKSPLVISSAQGSCGCTVPDYPRDPVAPGKTAIMKVSFNSHGKSGHQEKSVTINTNSTRGTHMLYIKADVAADKNASGLPNE